MVALRRETPQPGQQKRSQPDVLDLHVSGASSFRPRIVTLGEASTTHTWNESDETAASAFVREIKQYPTLSYEEEQALAVRMQCGDTAARDRLIECNLRWVVAIAWRYARGRAHLLDDLIGEGRLALCSTITQFNPAFGWRLTTYVTWAISRDIARACDEMSRGLHVPVYIVDGEKQILRFCDAFATEHGREPSVDEISEALQKRLSSVARIKANRAEPVQVISLETTLGISGSSSGSIEAGATVGETLPATDLAWCDPQTQAASAETSARVAQIVQAALTPRECQFVALYYGEDERLRGVPQAALQQACARLMGVSRQRAEQLHRNALRKLKAPELGLLDAYNWSLAG